MNRSRRRKNRQQPVHTKVHPKFGKFRWALLAIVFALIFTFWPRFQTHPVRIDKPSSIASKVTPADEEKSQDAIPTVDTQWTHDETTSASKRAAAPPNLPTRDSGAVPPPKRRKRPRIGQPNGMVAKSLPKLPKSTGVLTFTEHPIWASLEDEVQARFLWGEIPDSIQQRAVSAEPPLSNLRPDDYAGAAACKECHVKNYQSWSQHPHRWMNAKANPESVLGDFSGEASISYRGGTGIFYMDGDHYRMRLERNDIVRVYSINRTIGSRFQQYYVGKLLEGPEPPNHPIRQLDYVLPFGYWLDQSEWVPVVHVDLELPDDERHDPFLHPANRAYDRSCASCHTTQVAGDRLLRAVGRERLAAFSPHNVMFNGLGYLQENRHEVLKYAEFYAVGPKERVKKALSVMDDLAAETYAAALGITCEGCHNGSRKHAESETIKPQFFPSGNHLAVLGEDAESVWGRNRANVNWTCAQCHTGGRSMFACGASTWNSTEYSDALRGACYDPEVATEWSMHALTCVHCHDPHVATGKRWQHTADFDDQRCLSCHAQFNDAEQRRGHTHHPAGSEGDRCMNCHMPKINEGMQDVVRTHLIFSPTDPAMLEANDPNACNLCHLNKGIDWTLGHLESWYGLSPKHRAGQGVDEWKIYDDSQITKNYPDRQDSVGLGWLQSNNEATRLVAVEALAKARARWALPQMLNMLDDEYMLNRQFAAQRLEEMLNIDLEQRFGYRHYQYKAERARPIKKIREELE